MKKILLILVSILLLTGSFVFAEDQYGLTPTLDNGYAALLDGSYPKSARSLGMGGSGIAVGGRSDSFYMNPALLAKKTLISLPYAQVTLYHPYDLVKKNENGSSILDDIISAANGGDLAEIAGPLGDFLSTIKTGRGKLAEVEAGITLGGGGFALGVHVKDTLHTFSYASGGLDSQLFDELNVNILANIAIRFNFASNLSLDVGLASGLSIIGYTELIGAQTFLDMFSSETNDPMSAILDSTPLAIGYYVPLNIGLNLNLPFGFSIGAVGRNLLNSSVGVRMHTFDRISNLYEDTNFGDVFTSIFETDFTYKMDPRLDIGFGWKWENAFFSPTIAADIVDVVGLFSADELDGREFIEHLRLGAEVRLLSFLDVRGGINSGYWTVGAGIDLWAIKLDMAYYWQEFGERAGDYGLDAFTIRFNIGFDR